MLRRKPRTLRVWHWNLERPVPGEYLMTPAGSAYGILDVLEPAKTPCCFRIQVERVSAEKIPEGAVIYGFRFSERPA